MNAPATHAVPGLRRRALPLLLVIALAALFSALLRNGPRELPSFAVAYPAPPLQAERLDRPGEAVPASQAGRAWVLNVWASWCAPCLAEHPLLLALARDAHTPLVGLNHLDSRAPALAWLARHGDPFEVSGFDPDGSVARAWGVAGVPQTFVIDASGTVRWRHVGRLTPQVVDTQLRPLLQALQSPPGS